MSRAQRGTRSHHLFLAIPEGRILPVETQVAAATVDRCALGPLDPPALAVMRRHGLTKLAAAAGRGGSVAGIPRLRSHRRA